MFTVHSRHRTRVKAKPGISGAISSRPNAVHLSFCIKANRGTSGLLHQGQTQSIRAFPSRQGQTRIKAKPTSRLNSHQGQASTTHAHQGRASTTHAHQGRTRIKAEHASRPNAIKAERHRGRTRLNAIKTEDASRPNVHQGRTRIKAKRARPNAIKANAGHPGPFHQG